MTEDKQQAAAEEAAGIPEDVLRFLLTCIDTVSHLEALLLLRELPIRNWSDEEIAARLYVPLERARSLLQDLMRHHLISPVPASPREYHYEVRTEEDAALIDRVAETYRRQLIRIANLIHSKASPAVRDFARAFEFKRK